MLEIIIAVSIVVIVMIFLMFSVLKKTVQIINQQSKDYFITKLQDYDELIESKVKTLNNLNERLNELNDKNNESTLNKAEEKNSSYFPDLIAPEYRDCEYFKKYKKVTENFNFEKKEIILNFIKNNTSSNDIQFYNLLNGIKKKFSFDIIYKLTVMSNQDQINIIDGFLSKDEKPILKKYLSNVEQFDCLGFLNYINDLNEKYDPTIYIKVGSKTENYDNLNEFIRTEYDDSICIGIIIIYKNKLYDYTLS
ncbi:MAG: hypothetical protein ACM3O4_00320 [Ignavibacteriales bacterium]